MFFISVQQINRLISKGLSNIYSQAKIVKNWRFQNFDFLDLKNLSPGQFLDSSNSRTYHWILKLLISTQRSGSKTVRGFSILLILYKINLLFLCISLNKKMDFNKNEWKWERKWKIPHAVLEGRTLCFSSYKNRKLKVKLWWVGACKRKKMALCEVYCPKEIIWSFFNASLTLALHRTPPFL